MDISFATRIRNSARQLGLVALWTVPVWSVTSGLGWYGLSNSSLLLEPGDTAHPLLILVIPMLLTAMLSATVLGVSSQLAFVIGWIVQFLVCMPVGWSMRWLCCQGVSNPDSSSTE